MWLIFYPDFSLISHTYTFTQINNNDTISSKIPFLRQIAHLLKRVEKQRERQTLRPAWLAPPPSLTELQRPSATPTCAVCIPDFQPLSASNTSHVSKQSSSPISISAAISTALTTSEMVGSHILTKTEDAEPPLSLMKCTILSFTSTTTSHFMTPTSAVRQFPLSSGSAHKLNPSFQDATLLVAPGREFL